MKLSARFGKPLVATAVVLSLTGAAWCYEDPVELLDNFAHYTMIAKPDLAAANAQALLNTGITNAELATLLDEGKVTVKRFDEALSRAHKISELEPIASDLEMRVEAGRLDLARNPKRIEEAVAMLNGTLRQRTLAKNRIAAAKEYAVPSLLKQITEGQDEQLKIACQSTLIEIGGPAVQPLCEALLQLTGVSQRIVCDVLGTIRHANAAPYLRELALNPKADGPNRDAANRAFASLGVTETDLSALYTGLARDYFSANESLIPFSNEPTNNIWSYSNFTGLSPTPVPTPIFPQIMAMRTSSKAIALKPANAEALSLFVASNLKRENDLPQGAADPVYGESKYSPEFYATVFGTQTGLDVLGLAIDKLDTPLVRDAIAALSKSTGGANLFARSQGRQPLLEALNYPDRRVQYEAALTLGRALPQMPFAGDFSVVPTLASAVRMGNQALALVIVDDPENRGQEVSRLEKLGFLIVGAGSSVSDVQADIGRAVGVDLVVVRVPGPDNAKDTIAALRSVPKTSAAPILVLAAAIDQTVLDRDYRDDRRVKPVRSNVNDQQYAVAIETVMNSASGGRITEAESEQYAIYALAALEDIAIARNPVYQVGDAEAALIDAIDTRTGGTRMLVAKILALIDTDAAQRKLFDAALAAKEDEQVELLGHVADSVRLFGNRSEPRHVSAIVDLVANSSGPTAEAAATVHGALNLPVTEAVKLIPQS